MSIKMFFQIAFLLSAIVGPITIVQSYPRFAEKCISEKSHEFLTEQCKEKLANLV
jgi:hypothetical protein